MLYSTKARQARILVMYLMLTVAVACLPGMAWAGDWTHDGTDGATTMVALPGGQAMLARDGADRQARTITYVPTSGATTTITRAYGPSGHKAVEVENGTVRRHVYGAGPAPLLRVEGDGSLTYQVGPDTISVDGTGSTTVAHLVMDIKQSTVAVLDAQGQPRQQVAYGTLGQSTSKQNSAGVYATAVQLSGYEGLSAWQLGMDQLIDNRARAYFPLAGRFLALDAAGEALGYEARGNNWIMRADYDGYMDKLVAALKKDRRIVVAIGEDHTKLDGIELLMALIDKLEENNIPFKIYQESHLLRVDQKNYNRRLADLGITKRVRQLYKDGHLRYLSGDVRDIGLDKDERELVLDVFAHDEEAAYHVKNLEFRFSPSRAWDIQMVKDYAEEESAVTILFMGSAHLLPLNDFGEHYYQRPKDGEKYNFTFIFEDNIAYLQPAQTFDLVSDHTLLGIMSNRKAYREEYKLAASKAKYDYEKVVNPLNKKHAYRFFTTSKAVEDHPALKGVFNVDSDENDEKKNEDGDHNPLLNPQSKPAVENIKKEIEEGSKEEQMRHGSCSGCLMQ